MTNEQIVEAARAKLHQRTYPIPPEQWSDEDRFKVLVAGRLLNGESYSIYSDVPHNADMITEFYSISKDRPEIVDWAKETTDYLGCSYKELEKGIRVVPRAPGSKFKRYIRPPPQPTRAESVRRQLKAAVDVRAWGNLIYGLFYFMFIGAVIYNVAHWLLHWP